MAVPTSFSPGARPQLAMPLPMPPPLLHTRSGNEAYERPQTPQNNGFTSPFQTPQGSPSKKQLPPGANELPAAFGSALNLGPPSTPKVQPKSAAKQGLSVINDNVAKNPFEDPTHHNHALDASPTRQSNKENTPTGVMRLGKDAGIQQNHAALSRQEPYQAVEKRIQQIRGPTAEELQKLQLPRTKRLANVTQLCMFF